MSIKSMMMRCFIGTLKLIYTPMKLRRTKNRITILSRQSKEKSKDIALLSDYIRKTYGSVECKCMIKFIESGIANKLNYGLHIISQMWAIAASKVVVLDGYCIVASVVNHKKSTRVIQMWHSMAAIKKFGIQTIDKAAGHSSEIAEIMCMHKNYDYVICPSQKTGNFLCQGFGCSQDKLVELCLPRIDYIKQQCEKKEEKLIETNKEILLYAPTFRKNDTLKVRELFQSIDYERFVLVVKPHPLYEESFNEMVSELCLDGKVILDSENGTFDWLGSCDRVITDYSAVAVESLVTGKPLYFYVYDINEYEKTVGLNVNPLKEVPSITAQTEAELRALLEGEYDMNTLNKFRETYLTADTENCTEKLADFIIGVLDGNA